MPNYTPLINGQSYGWGDIIINILGRDVVGRTAIMYSDDTEKENVYGAGNLPIARGRGATKAEASITLLMEEIIALQDIAPDRNLSNIPAFDVIVKFMPIVPGRIVTDIIRNCEFTGNKRDIKQGDKSIAAEFKLVTSHITWNKP
jgi:hypothetical protein